MLRLRRLHLDQIGDTSARFSTTTFDLRDPADDATLDTIVWLRNGGGKTSLLSLMFSLILPAQRDFLGSRREDGKPTGRCLADYVASRDTSNVIAEWEGPDGLVVTGAVYEWPNRTRPSQHRDHQGDLVKRWYVFRPLDGILDFDSLPVRQAGQRAPLETFTNELRTLSRAHLSLELKVAYQIKEWHTALRAKRIDPDAFRYQKEMNGREGGIDDLFRFRSPQAFIDFFIDLVADSEAQTSLRDRLRQQADRLASGPALGRELDYCNGVADRLEPLAQSWGTLAARAGDLDAARRQAAELAGTFNAGAAAAAADAERTAAEIAVATGRQTEVRTERRAVQQLAATYRRRGAEMWAAATAERCRDADEDVAVAAAAVAGWDALEDVIAASSAASALAEVEADIAARAAAAEPDRADRDRVTARLRARLTSLAGELRSTQAAAGEAERAARSDAERLDGEAQQQKEQAGSHRARAEEATKRLIELDVAIDTARDAGHLEPGEAPAAGFDRARAELEGARTELEQLQRRAERRRTTRDRLSTERAGAETERAQQQALADADTEQAEQLRGEADAHAVRERVRELAQTDDVNLWAAAPVVLEGLDAAARRAAARVVELGVQAAAHRRNFDALSDSDLLPPSADVETVLAVLDAAGVAATPGLTFLARSVPRRAWDATIDAHPGLLSGIVVDKNRYDDAVRAAVDAGLHPGSLVTIAAKEAVLSDNGETAFVVPPSPALFDVAAAATERTRLQAVLDQVTAEASALTAAADTDRALRAELAAFIDRCPADRIPALERSAAAASARARTAAERLRALQDELDQLDGEDEADTERRAEVEADAATATGRVEALRTLVAADARRAEWETDRDRNEQVAAAADIAAGRATAEAGAKRSEADVARTRAAEAGRHAEDLEAEHDDLTLIDAATAADDDGTVDLDELRRRAVAAHERWARAASDDTLIERRQQADRTARDTKARLRRHDDAAVAHAQELLATGGALDAAERAARRREAASRHEHAIDLRQAAAVVAAEATRELEAAKLARVRVLAPEEEPADRHDAAEKRLAAEERAAHLQAEETDLERRLADLGVDATAAAQREAAFRNHANALVALIDVDGADVDGAPFAGTLDDAEAELDEGVIQFSAARDAHAGAAKKVTDAVADVRRFATDRDHAKVGPIVDAVLRTDGDDALGAGAEELAKLHRDRAAVIRHDLAALAGDREILVTELAGQVRRMLDLISRAPRTSTLPEELGEWRNKQFLTISFEDPRDADADLRRRVGEEIDRIVEAGKIPDGVDTLKRAVHAAVPKGFTVRVLKPTPDLTDERVDITIMTDWSGGEKLTAAVLLYCTLAKLRAGSRKTGFGGGALILDNPLGTSNYVRFVALQRRVAKALRVQLVYTTAVQDITAVGTFPNVIRCRNVRPTGHDRRFVDATERVGDAHARKLGEVSAARIARIDTAPAVLATANEPDAS